MEIDIYAPIQMPDFKSIKINDQNPIRFFNISKEASSWAITGEFTNKILTQLKEGKTIFNIIQELVASPPSQLKDKPKKEIETIISEKVKLFLIYLSNSNFIDFITFIIRTSDWINGSIVALMIIIEIIIFQTFIFKIINLVL